LLNTLNKPCMSGGFLYEKGTISGEYFYDTITIRYKCSLFNMRNRNSDDGRYSTSVSLFVFIYYYLPDITMRQSRVSKHEAGQ